jgi:hypothetical protein
MGPWLPEPILTTMTAETLDPKDNFLDLHRIWCRMSLVRFSIQSFPNSGLPKLSGKEHKLILSIWE